MWGDPLSWIFISILNVCYKKPNNRYTKSLSISDTNKYCQQFSGFRGLCFVESAWSEQTQQECRLQHVIALTLIHIESLWHTVNYLKACHSVFMEYFPHFNTGDKCTNQRFELFPQIKVQELSNLASFLLPLWPPSISDTGLQSILEFYWHWCLIQ